MLQLQQQKEVNMYTIKELAEKTGIIPNAIRFYEKKGLLYPKRTEEG